MTADPLAEVVSLVTTDYVAITRGRAMARSDYEREGAIHCGWVPANMSLTPFDVIASPNPWGSLGDLRLLADRSARYRCWPQGAASALDFVMGDLTELDGAPWTCCPRAFLKAALADFQRETGCRLIAAFEQELQMLGTGWPAAPAFGLAALRRAGAFGPQVMAALSAAGCEPELFIAEYGQDQYEIVTRPADGLVAADRAIAVREILRESARLIGARASFAPKTAVTGVGNGVHIHFSFLDSEGRPTAYDATAPGRLSPLAGSFAAGIIKHLPALIALTAPSPASYLRLKPHHWSASYTWLGERDREASLRICPTTSLGGRNEARQFNLEFRAADATACPHLALGALIRAGLEGVRAKLPAPPLFSGDPETLSDAERQRWGLYRLPQSLGEALETFERDRVAASWFSDKARATYLGVKRMEIEMTKTLTADELCQRYAAIY